MSNVVSTDRFGKNMAFSVSVRFTRYCGNMCSCHFFLCRVDEVRKERFAEMGYYVNFINILQENFYIYRIKD